MSATPEWHDIAGFPYQVSDGGAVRRYRRKTHDWRLMKPWYSNDGYVKVDLCRRGTKTRFFVHLLVAAAFLPAQPASNYQIDHKDGDKKNNAKTNLEWVTPKVNRHRADELGLIHYHRINLTDADIAVIKSQQAFRGLITMLASKYGVSRTSIYRLREEGVPA